MTSPPERRPGTWLMGAHEACQALGIPYESRGNLYKLANLPDPAAELKCGKVWLAADIERLAASREETTRAREARRREK